MLDERLEEFARELGADFFGVADITPAEEFIKNQGGDIVSGYPLAISLGIVLLIQLWINFHRDLKDL